MLSALCVGALAIAGARPALAQNYKITQAGFRVLYMGPIFVALDQGLFKARGVDFTFTEIDSGALGMAAVLSGDAQISDLDPLGVAEVKKQGKSPLMIYNLVDRVTLDLVIRNEALKKTGVDVKAPVLERAKALKGLNIGITRAGAPTDIYARYFLIKAGLDPERDATLIQIGGVPALDSAFRSGRIDAFLLSPPLPQTLESAGIGTILIRNTAGEMPELTDTCYDALFTTAEYARANGPALKAYAQAVQDAVKWIKGHRDEALKLLGEKWFKDTKPESLALSLDALMPAVSSSGRFTEAAVRKYLDIFKSIGQSADADVTEGVLWSNEFVK
ncbi:MAG TPA: ABC transporter substrate-binding protein [Stellaceae bacterium]|nr:ABC transporter substrate-binding protein [Stellaceae bacterium]